MEKNYYGSLCTEMYEILHPEAPGDELDFYLSYADRNMSILEPLCGSGRFLIPFQQRGYDIQGFDSSIEMLTKLKEKTPDAEVFIGNILEQNQQKQFDYIFISSGSVSLFTDMVSCRKILINIKKLLKPNGVFVFAVDTIKCRCKDDSTYKTSIKVKTKDGFDLILKEKHFYDEKTNTQYSPGIYELYDGNNLLKQETMDFQTHLYKLGEMDAFLHEAGFSKVNVYSSYDKTKAENNETEMFLYECSF